MLAGLSVIRFQSSLVIDGNGRLDTFIVGRKCRNYPATMVFCGPKHWKTLPKILEYLQNKN